MSRSRGRGLRPGWPGPRGHPVERVASQGGAGAAPPVGSERAGSDRGAGSILVLTGLGLLVAMGLVAVAVVAAQIGGTRAAGAADLAALAAASRALSGAESACARAADVAAANGARLEACRLSGAEAWVEVSVANPEALRRALRVPAATRARAHAELVVSDSGR